MSEQLITIMSCAILTGTGSTIKLMFDLMRDKHIKFRYALVRSVLSLMVGGWLGYLSVIWGYNPTKEATPYIILTLVGFSLDAILAWLQANGHKILLKRVLGKRLNDELPDEYPQKPL